MALSPLIANNSRRVNRASSVEFTDMRSVSIIQIGSIQADAQLTRDVTDARIEWMLMPTALRRGENAAIANWPGRV
jgi:hypothetical protein